MKLMIPGAILVRDNIYFVDRNLSTICFFDKVTYEIKILKRFNELPRDFAMHSIYYANNYFYVTSQKTLDIIKYSDEYDECEYIKSDINVESTIYSSVFVKDEKIVLIPRELMHGIIVYNCSLDNYTKISINKSNCYYGGLTKRAICVDSQVMFPVLNTNIIVNVDIDTGVITTSDLEETRKITDLAVINNKILYYDNSRNTLVVFFEKTEFEIELVGVLIKRKMFSNILVDSASRKIIMIPSECSQIIIIDDSKIVIRDIPSSVIKERENGCSLFWDALIVDNKVFFWPWGLKDLLILDLNTYDLFYKKIGYSSNDLLSLIRDNRILSESSYVNVSDFVEYIVNYN